MDTQIPLATIRKASELLLQHVEELEGHQVTIDVDYFWSIPREQLYDVLKDPVDLTIGQITESLANLESIVAEPDGTISYGLVWLADVLRAVGHSVVK